MDHEQLTLSLLHVLRIFSPISGNYSVGSRLSHRKYIPSEAMWQQGHELRGPIPHMTVMELIHFTSLSLRFFHCKPRGPFSTVLENLELSGKFLKSVIQFLWNRTYLRVPLSILHQRNSWQLLKSSKGNECT